MRSPARLLLLAVLASAAVAAPAAHAQATGFSLDRFEPSERGSDWFENESLDLRGAHRLAIGVVGDYAYQPLAIYNPDGSVRTALVQHQLFVHVGASFVVLDRLRFAFNLPIAAYEAGTTGTLLGTTYAAPGSAGVGDLRLGADVRLVGEYASPFTLAAGVQVFVPIGSRANYTGDESVRLQPRLMAAGDIGIFTYSARLGFQYRGLSDSIGGVAVGNELTGAVAAGLRIADRKLTVGPELWTSATLTDGSQIFKATTTPVEALFGAHYVIGSDWRIGAGAGGGLTRGLGAPTARVVAVLEYAPGIEEKKPEPSDRDHDGILDDDDACPDVAGIKTDDPKTNGCPPPPPDRDHDGILDADDACPDVPGVKTDDPKTNGCPPDPDRDKDGIPNGEDACPDEPGPKNVDPKKNGCPAAVVKNDQIVIVDQVKFATGSAVILPASDAILKAVLGVLEGHPEIKKISVEGHTDNAGTAPNNQKLSTARAASVVTWLVKHGVDKGRLTSAGFGQDKPIDTNDTPEGRQNNRRVEFHIVGDKAAP